MDCCGVGMEKYSVLMSVYFKEKAKFLELAIESILNQSIPPDEIILIKDGKLTFELDEVISSYATMFPKLFKILLIEENKGLWNALNVGLQNAKNELVARMDTDDISLPERCEKQLMLFEKEKELALVGTNIAEFYDEPQNIISERKVPSEYNNILKFSRRRNPFNHPTVMYKKTVILECGGYPSNPGSEDYQLFTRVIYEGNKVKNINESLLLYRADEGNFRRRRGWIYASSHIKSVYQSWRIGHSSFIDLVFVVFVRIIVFFSPVVVLKKISMKYLRSN